MIGYKGFNQGLKCLSYTYEVGKVHEYSDKISLCAKGFHFCQKLGDVFNYYSDRPYYNHVFAVVEALGEIKTGGNKSVTDKLKVIKILSKEEINVILAEEKKEELDNDIFCLDIIRELQKDYNFSIGGSAALHLQGLTLERNKGQIDFDVVMPYYQKIVGYAGKYEVEEFDAKSSGNDFSITYALTTPDGRFLKLDVRIKPEQNYDLVEYKEHTYKCSDLFTILAAKIKYASEGNSKHKQDVLFLLNKQKPKKSNSYEPF